MTKTTDFTEREDDFDGRTDVPEVGKEKKKKKTWKTPDIYRIGKVLPVRPEGH